MLPAHVSWTIYSYILYIYLYYFTWQVLTLMPSSKPLMALAVSPTLRTHTTSTHAWTPTSTGKKPMRHQQAQSTHEHKSIWTRARMTRSTGDAFVHSYAPARQAHVNLPHTHADKKNASTCTRVRNDNTVFPLMLFVWGGKGRRHASVLAQKAQAGKRVPLSNTVYIQERAQALTHV
jgi:hypothetical protein